MAPHPQRTLDRTKTTVVTVVRGLRAACSHRTKEKRAVYTDPVNMIVMALEYSSRRGAVVLCGGHSRRMGMDKAWLRVGEEYLLQRLVRIVRRVVPRVIVSARPAQALPELGRDVLIVRDVIRDAGPLGGLSAALHVLAKDTHAAFVCACDHPLLRTELIRAMFDRFDVARASTASELTAPSDEPGNPVDPDGRVRPCTHTHGTVKRLVPGALVPHYEGRAQPLLAVYALDNLPLLHALLRSGERRAHVFASRCGAQRIDADELRHADTRLDSFLNVNSPDQLALMAQRLGQRDPTP